MKNILFDLTSTQPIRGSKFHGGGDYAEVVFNKIIYSYNKDDINLYAAYDSSRYINIDLIEKAKSLGVILIDIKEVKPTEILQTYKIDRFYSPLIQQSLGWKLDFCETIVTIHGLRQIEMPANSIELKYCSTNKQKFNIIKKIVKQFLFKEKEIKSIVSNSSINNLIRPNIKIITVSNHSKFSILSFYPQIKEENIKICYSPSFNQLENNSIKSIEFSKIKEKINIEAKKYFLLTNAERWIKNAIRAIQAFDLILDDKKFCDYKLVLTGVINKKIFKKEIKHKENFVLLDYIERDELECLFENSYAFIYPSLNEGFGYPPLSAMKYGVPVITSGSSSIPEVCGNAAIYFDPYSIYEIKNRILQLSDKEIYNECSKNGLERFAYISEFQKKDLQRLSQIILQ